MVTVDYKRLLKIKQCKLNFSVDKCEVIGSGRDKNGTTYVLNGEKLGTIWFKEKAWESICLYY